MKIKSKTRATAILIITSLLLIMFACIHVYCIGWTTSVEVVSTESTDDSVSTSLRVGPDGTVHIAWRDETNYDGSGTDRDIFYKRFVPGTGWTTTEVVSTESTDDSYGPSLGVSSDGTVHVAWLDETDYGGSGTDRDIFYKRFEPGAGWTLTEVVSTESPNSSNSPSLDVDSDGAVHIAWEDGTDYGSSGADYDIFYRKFVPDTGWTTSVEVVSTESTDDSRSPSLDVGPDGTVHIAWHDDKGYGEPGADYDIFYRKFVPDTGWTTAEVVSTESTETCRYPSLGVGVDGTVHIAWYDYIYHGVSGVPQDILYKRFVPETGWTSTEVVSTESTASLYSPSLGVGVDGTVHIAWQDDTDYAGFGADYDIFYRRFVQGAGWTTIEVVSTESTMGAYNPSLDVGSDGAVHIAWSDDTDYGGAGTDFDILYKSINVNALGTVDDYDGQWRTADFTITLTDTNDVSGTSEIYYKINDGATMSVDADGQPYITTEGANNKLEYWSVDNADNEELPHKVLVGIKLDKTVPTGSVEIVQVKGGDEETTYSELVTLTLSAEDPESGVAEMRISNDGSSWSSWEEYFTSKYWELTSGDGTKTVYVQFRNGAGLDSASISDTITLEKRQTDSSFISCSLSPTTITVGETTTISGSLSHSLAEASILIQGRPNGGDWTTIATVSTDSEGGYSYVWSPTTAGTWEVKASWNGDETRLPSESQTQSIIIEAASGGDGTGFPWLYLIAGIIVIAIILIAVFLFLRRNNP